MSDLPQGWASAEFGEIAEIKLGKMLDKARNRGEQTPYLRNINVRWGAFDLKDILQMPMSSDERAALSIQNGDILVCEGGEPGRSAVWQCGSTTLTFQKALMRLRPRAGTYPHLLTAFLRWSYDTGELERHFTGTTIKHLPQSALAQVRLPLPPLPEQWRIVAKIDSLTGKSKRARDHLDHIPRLVEKYKQAILAAAFRGDLTGTRRTPNLIQISEIVASLDQGWSPKCESDPANADEWGVIKTTAIQPVEFLSHENKRLPANLTPRPGIIVNAGDVLITRAGPRSRVAISCIVTENHPKLMLCDKAYRLRIKQDKADPAFVTYMLNSPQCLAALEIMKTGISDSGLNLTQGKFMTLEMPEFSLAEQAEIVRHIESAFTWIDRLAADATSARKLIEHLDQAVLAKAFRGELVPQDPADEPASVLLDRIRAERAAAPKAKRGRRKTA